MATLEELMGMGQTGALADRLRGRQRAADFFGMSTIEPLAQAAQREQQAIGDERGQQRALRRAMAVEQARTAREAAAAKQRQEFDAEQAELDRANRLAIAQARGSATADARRTDQAASRLDTSLQKYAKDLEKTNLPRIEQDIQFVDSLLDELPRDEEGNITEVPGVGYGQNLPGLGAVLTLAEEVGPGNDQASQMRGAIQRVLNTEIRTQSGAAVTLQEMIRNRIGSGVDFTSSDEDFLRFWPVIKDTLAAVRSNYDAGYGPDVVDIYNRRLQGENITSREYLEGGSEVATKEGAEISRPTTEEEYDAIPSGAMFIDPDDGRTYRKP